MKHKQGVLPLRDEQGSEVMHDLGGIIHRSVFKGAMRQLSLIYFTSTQMSHDQ